MDRIASFDRGREHGPSHSHDDDWASISPHPVRGQVERKRSLQGMVHRLIFGPEDEVEETVAAPTEKLSAAEATSRVALAFLAEHGLDPVPAHYQLAWTCAVSPTSALSLAVAQRIAETGRLTQEDIGRILSEDRAEAMAGELSELVQRARHSIADGNRVVSNSRKDVADFGEALRSDLDRRTRGDLPSEDTALLRLTEAMIDKASQAEAQLREVSSELVRAQKRADDAERLADTDPLTALPNRRAFARLLDQEMALARDSGRALALAFCDIDHFKDINDRHGHATGDRVLRFIADMMQRMVDRHCHVARYGGEEFVLVFPGMGEVEAVAQMDMLREELASRRLVAADTHKSLGRVTFSVGVSTLGEAGDAADLVQRADSALYRAKNEGRNRVVA